MNSAFPFFYGNLMHAVPMPIKASSLSPFPGSPDLHAESMESVGYRRNLICNRAVSVRLTHMGEDTITRYQILWCWIHVYGIVLWGCN